MQQMINELSKVLASLKKPQLISGFLKQILTPNELKELNLRWQLVKMLHQKMPQRTIAKKLKVSLCKITRGSRELKKKNSTFLKILNR